MGYGLQECYLLIVFCFFSLFVWCVVFVCCFFCFVFCLFFVVFVVVAVFYSK